MEKLAVAERISPQRIIQALNWRYATKVFDPVKKIPEELFDQLIEVLRLAPSSIGLQPWKFIIVKNPTIRKQLKKYSMDQSQLVDSSHLIIICSLKHIDEAYVDRVIATEKLLSPDSPLEKFKSFALGYLNSLSKEEQVQWMAQQCYIALGFLLSCCAMLEIDACPMEAFDRGKFDEILGLDLYGVETRTAVALGYRAINDMHSRHPKMRFGREEIVVAQ